MRLSFFDLFLLIFFLSFLGGPSTQETEKQLQSRGYGNRIVGLYKIC